MQEISGSLSEVIRAYSDHNLLVPAATDVQLNPFYKYHVEEVAVDLSENSGDIFKVGSVKTGKTDSKGNDIWQDTYSLSKPLLNKLAMAAGIQFNPHQTYGRRIDSITYRAQAQGAMRKADGTYRSEVDQKEIHAREPRNLATQSRLLQQSTTKERAKTLSLYCNVLSCMGSFCIFSELFHHV